VNQGRAMSVFDDNIEEEKRIIEQTVEKKEDRQRVGVDVHH
jgi:hypothetical protein